MTIANVYNQPGSSSEYFTLANNTHTILASYLGKCKIGVETDTGYLGYTDQTGYYRSINPNVTAGVTLPTNLSGFLNNDGAGNMSWKTAGVTLPTANAGFLWDDGAGNNDWRLPTPSQIGAAPLNNPSFTGAPTLGNASASTINISGVSTFNSVSAVSLNVSANATLGSVSSGLIRSTGPILSSGGAVGYTSGTGGTISQAANKGSAVTLAKLCGQITMQNTALVNATTVSFVMNNALLLQNDMVLINHQSVGTLGAYQFSVAPGNGLATISVRNIHTASLSEAIVLQFLVIRAAVA
ncbi:MAG: hypothetical protein WBM07_10735 [Chitinivibrionales bacterium]